MKSNIILRHIIIISQMPQLLQHLQQGNIKSPELIIFLQGWPDNSQIWQWINWRQELAHKHLLFINFPNTNGKLDCKWGKDFPELIQDLRYTIDHVQANSEGCKGLEGCKRKILVAHDWGCFYGYMFDEKYPGFFQNLIMLDVPAIVELKNVKQMIYVMIYQMALLLAFLIAGPIGRSVTQKAAKVFKHDPLYFSRISWFQNYPYYYLWRNKFLSVLKVKQPYLKNYRPSAPVYYLYGGNKPFQFHGPKWLKMVEESGGETHRMDGGHWFMKKFPKFVTDLVLKKIAPKL